MTASASGKHASLGVSTSGYYEWKSRAPSTRSIRHAWLTDLIGQIHESSCGTYGRMQVRAELQRSHEITVGQNTVGLLMLQSGLVRLPLRVAPSVSPSGHRHRPGPSPLSRGWAGPALGDEHN
ncbi:IS3 family transposase [Microbacterium sp. DT81.1]|uniref:IS3 family transposase n=1 Tax=Microbacterium sp. DT81.1 TaxID=3393413 RepID=UPI003CF53C8A